MDCQQKAGLPFREIEFSKVQGMVVRKNTETIYWQGSCKKLFNSIEKRLHNIYLPTIAGSFESQQWNS